MAASDYVKAMPDSIDRWMPRRITPLGTDGFGRSEGRAALRDFFEVDAKSIVLATLVELAQRRHAGGVGGAEGHRRPGHQPREAQSRNQLRIPSADAHRRGSRLSDFTVPELGENVAGGDVAKVLVKVGDTVRREQPVIELETDKATIEVPSSVAGVVTDVRVKKGDKVKVGAVIFTVSDNGAGPLPRRRPRRADRRARRRPRPPTPRRHRTSPGGRSGGARQARAASRPEGGADAAAARRPEPHGRPRRRRHRLPARPAAATPAPASPARAAAGARDRRGHQHRDRHRRPAAASRRKTSRSTRAAS